MSTDADAEIARIASLLPIKERQAFISAINKIRAAERRGRVRVRAPKPPTAEEKLILDMYEAHGSIKDTAEALADLDIDINRVAYVTRKFGVREVIERNSHLLDNPNPEVRDYLKRASDAGMTAATVKKELSKYFGMKVSFTGFERLCLASGVSFSPPRFDDNRIDEVVDDIRNLELKYGVAIGTLYTKFREAIADYERARR